MVTFANLSVKECKYLKFKEKKCAKSLDITRKIRNFVVRKDEVMEASKTLLYV